jgi:hypothetical protein
MGVALENFFGGRGWRWSPAVITCQSAWQGRVEERSERMNRGAMDERNWKAMPNTNTSHGGVEGESSEEVVDRRVGNKSDIFFRP